MGKKSLIKSTSKKKRAPKKAAASKNPKKSPPENAVTAKAKPAAKAAKKEVPKKAAPAAKPVSVKDLLKKQFDIVVPKTLYSVPADKAGKSTFTAPELLAGYKAEDAKRIRGLLANTYSEKDLKAAAEKAAAEKAAAEKAAAEKAAAEKAAAEKAAAEKAAAEKAAAEKAAAEKAAAEKAAAEKAAAEKAAAEKAAAEKAAAEKAAAEKAAAEKAEAIRKAAAQKSDVKVSYEPVPAQAVPKKPSDPVDNTIKLIAAGLAFLILLITGASASNSFNYYLSDNQGTLEIWKGKFAPLGKKKLIALPGVPVPESIKEVYSADEVYPLAFQFYIDEADALLNVPGIPDFERIKTTLKKALDYGSTNELRSVAYARLDNIDRLILNYKADVAASRGTIADLSAAVGYLEAVSNLTTDDAQKEMVAKKIDAHKAVIQQLEAQAAAEKAAAEKAAAEKAAAEQAAAEAAAAEEAEAEQAMDDEKVAADEGQATGSDKAEAAKEKEDAQPEKKAEDH